MRAPLLSLPTAAVLLASAAQAATGDVWSASQADTNIQVIVTATRRPQAEASTPFFAVGANAADLQERQAVALPDALHEMPGVMVQKTAYGQGSPYIRGFTGFRTLLLVDGVRLNNATFREGANQYWATVDALMLDRLELVEGPASVLYGSDAIGGTVQAFSREPAYAPEGTWIAGGLTRYSYLSASESHIGRVEGYVADSETAALAGVSRKLFGDVNGGGNVGEQPHTGYDELDWDLKLRERLSPEREVVVAWQHDVMDDVWRTHKTIYGLTWKDTVAGDEKARVLDQARDLAYLQYRDNLPCLAYDALRVTLSWQRQSEDQVRVKKDDKGDSQGFDDTTLGLAAELRKQTDWGTWVYGADLYHERVQSYLDKVAADGTLAGQAIQGPVADDARYDTLGAYAEDTLPLADRLDMIVGARGTYARADAGRYQDPASGDEASMARDWWDLSGGARLVAWLLPDHTWNVYAGGARAFRAPNLSDLTRFDTARSDEIETPSPDVAAEHFLTGEIGTRYQSGRTRVQVAYFYTRMDDLIVRQPTGAVIDGLNEVTKRNASDGYVHGITLDAGLALTRTLDARLAGAWMAGYADAYDTTDRAQREPWRTMPATLNAALRWTAPSQRLWAEVAGTLASREDRLNTGDRADTQRIPPDGTPGYGTVSVRSGCRVTRRLDLLAAVENLGDTAYRIHGSGNNEPGRSLNLTAIYRF